MLILSQTKTAIINTDQCSVIVAYEGLDAENNKIWKIIAGTPTSENLNSPYCFLGQYDDEGTAKNIINAIFNSKTTFTMPQRCFDIGDNNV